MRFRPLVTFLLATFVAAGCDAYGGGMTDEGGGGSGFSVTSRYPAPGSSGVSAATYVEVGFDGIIDTTSVDAASLTLAGAPFGSVTVNGKKLRFTPSAPLTPGTSYSVSVSAELRGANGHLLGPNPTWGFKTAGATPPPDTLPPLGPRPR